MMDRNRSGADGFEDGAMDGADLDAVRDADRLLDAIGTGRTPDADDDLVRLLASARAESARDIPAAPVVPTGTAGAVGGEGDPEATVVAPAVGDELSERRSRRGARRSGSPLSAVLIGGGVAAALVVGGFTVASINGNGPGGDSSTVAENTAEQGYDRGNVPSEAPPAPDEGDAEEGDGAPAPEEAPPAEDAPQDEGMVLADPETPEEPAPQDGTDTTGDGAEGGGAPAEGDPEILAETPPPEGPMALNAPNPGFNNQDRGNGAPGSTSSSTSATPQPDAGRGSSDGHEPAPQSGPEIVETPEPTGEQMTIQPEQ